ncbi:HTH-type transcriptional regulator DegA [[Clostridium] hylemonae DSM 15053]|uniref:HTH-type transcriptional regulator DegA n=2 Tax=[Clostridium] hylemonae TaxID=89153 RepID=C0C245_9FIRM|nr:HTH-type transcriptional regulator DegA [[Clostridium] hylemonae DSM 15053]QEK19087.1 HTH-type transcriptional regulator DegA [[Clostridium] hylemonae DSM 15053]
MCKVEENLGGISNMKYKAKDIARELGVSPATVSLVLNNKPGVGEEKREEILKKIIELDCEYLLKDGGVKRGDIGFVIYKCGGAIVDEYPFFNYLSESLNKAIERNNYTMTMMYLDKSMPLNERYLALENFRYAGYIVYAVEMYPEDMEIFSKLNVPCVFIDNPFPTLAVDTVTVDNYLGIYQGFEYLYQMGHREFGYIKSKVPILCFEERMQAFEDCLRRRGLTFDTERIMEVGYMESETERDVGRYLDGHSKLPTAFLADNDLLACRAVQAMKRREIKVPDQVSIVGFDNRPICSFTDPKVTTVQLSGDEMGEMAVEMLMEKMSNKRKHTVKYKLGTKLIVNESVKKLV